MIKKFMLWCVIKMWGRSNGILIVIYQEDLEKDGDWLNCRVASGDSSYLTWAFVRKVFDRYSKYLEKLEEKQ